MSEAPHVAFLFFLAFLFAAVEIEVEGPHGWAERLPTWFRTRGRVARAYGLLMGGRPLTGYHLFMLPLPLAFFHLPYVEGVAWTWEGEARTLATYLAWAIVWDYLWFVLNPAWGMSRFRRGAVWWYGGRWVGPFPAAYALAMGTSLLLAGLAALGAVGAGALYEHLGLLAGLAVLTAGVVAAAPLYRRWYLRMRRSGTDDRERAGIR
jgi:hypothetical protein